MIITDKKQLVQGEISAVYDLDEISDIVSVLEKELISSTIKGIGLAAPQVGIKKAIAIVRIPQTKEYNGFSINLINPKIIEGNDIITFEEGCLSFPGLVAKTVRYSEIVVETLHDYNNESNLLNSSRYITNPNILEKSIDKRRLVIDGFSAVVVEHEMSHLLNLTMFDFSQIEVGRNDLCPCDSGVKNKRCCMYKYFNNNLKKLFNPKYTGEIC